MKRAIFYSVSISLFLALILSSLTPVSYAADPKKPKEVVLSTADIKDPYKVIGLISVRSGEVNLDTVNDKLKEEGKNLGADYVLGINYFTYSGYIYAYGTAVKLLKE